MFVRKGILLFYWSLLGVKKEESILKDNATAFTEASNMLYEPNYEKVVAKYPKNKSKELFGSIKYQG